MERRTYMALTSGAVITSLAGCSGEDSDFEEGNSDSTDGGNNSGSGSDEATLKDDVKILEHKGVRQNGGTETEQVAVEGRVENMSDESLSYVDVPARFYTENGDFLESHFDRIDNFDAGQTQEFRIKYIGLGEAARKVANYEIADLNIKKENRNSINRRDDVEIVEHKGIRQNGGTDAEQVAIEGRVENTGDEAFPYLEVQARFYNKNGVVLDSDYNNVDRLGAGQTWAFKIRYSEFGEDAREITNYDISFGDLGTDFKYVYIDQTDGWNGSDGGPDRGSLQDDMNILGHDLIRRDVGTDAEQVAVEGRVENTSDRSFSSAEALIHYYNDTGNLLGSSFDTNFNFAAGDTWAFENLYAIGEDAREVTDYDIAVGTRMDF